MGSKTRTPVMNIERSYEYTHIWFDNLNITSHLTLSMPVQVSDFIMALLVFVIIVRLLSWDNYPGSLNQT